MTTDSSSADALLPLGNIVAATHTGREQLVETLRSATDPALNALADRVPSAEAADTVHLVLVGQHSAGKSSLVRSLTGIDVPIGAGITTTTATSYPWRGHLIVDTPGVRAGEDEHHDEIVDDELRAADAVIFVITAEGFDDVTEAYFNRLRRRLRRTSQLILVVNKSKTEGSDPAAVHEHLRDVLGDLLDVIPIINTDARSWLQAASFPDPEARRKASGIPQLAEELDALVRSRGAHLRLATPLRELSGYVRDTLDRADPDPDSPALKQLDDLQAAIEEQREQLREMIDQVQQDTETQLAARLVRIGPDLDDDQLAGLVRETEKAFESALESEGDQLDPVGKALVLHGEVLPAAHDDRPVLSAFDNNPEAWSLIRGRLLNGFGQVARTFGGEGARPGGVGHTTVTRIWHGLGGKFRPWGAVRAAQRTAKVAKVLGPALVIGEAAYGFWQDQQEARAAAEKANRLRSWRTEAADLAHQVVEPWATAAHDDAEQRVDAQVDVVARQRIAIRSRRASVDTDLAALTELQERFLDLLGQLEH